ncbi:MAG: adenylate kinase family protein [Bacillota bacterium]
MKYKSILLFGAPGSGKGTQGKVIGQIPGFIHTSTGDLFRSLDKQSEMGKIFMQYSSKGQLVPDDFTVKLWTNAMGSLEKAGKLNPATDILVMDGIPRSLKQAEMLADTIDVLKILYLDVTDMNKMVDRLRGRALKEKRFDDADEKVIRNRFTVYDKETRPVLDFYPKDKIAKVDALMTPINVLRAILDILAPVRDAVDRAASK